MSKWDWLSIILGKEITFHPETTDVHIAYEGGVLQFYPTRLIEGIPLDPNDSMYTQLEALVRNGDIIEE